MILLEKLRREQNKSARTLWVETGVDPSYISFAERRGFKMFDTQLRKLADALGYKGDPSDLLSEVEKEKEDAR